MATTLAGRRSFFDSTVYQLLSKLEQVEMDPIFSLYGDDNVGTETGDTVNFTSQAVSKYGRRVSPGADIPRTEDTEGDTLAKAFVSYKDELLIEWETTLHDKLGLMNNMTDDLSERVLNAIALEMSRQLLTSADSTTMTVLQDNGNVSVSIATADGAAPGSASHTRPGTGATTYSNLLSGADALDEGSFHDLVQQMKQNSVSEAGSHLGFRADTIIIPDDQTMIAKAVQLTKSELVSESGNNAINVLKSPMGIDTVVLKHAPLDSTGSYSTADQYHWAVANRRLLSRGFRYSWAVRPTQVGIGLIASFAEDNIDQKINVASRFVFGAPDWAGIGYSFSTTKPTLA